jgi:hypothetical protein
LAQKKLWLIFAAMSRGTSSANRFRSFRFRTGLEESDATPVPAVEALRKFNAGDFTAEQTDAALAAIFAAGIRKVCEAPPHVVAVPAEVDSDKAVFPEM